MTNGEKIKALTMKLSHCKNCGAFIGSYGCDELCPTCRRKETYLTKEEVVSMLEELNKEIDDEAWTRECMDASDERIVEMDSVNKIIQQKINKLKGEENGNK